MLARNAALHASVASEIAPGVLQLALMYLGKDAADVGESVDSQPLNAIAAGPGSGNVTVLVAFGSSNVPVAVLSPSGRVAVAETVEVAVTVSVACGNVTVSETR
eukprot:gene14220-biopygen6176